MFLIGALKDNIKIETGETNAGKIFARLRIFSLKVIKVSIVTNTWKAFIKWVGVRPFCYFSSRASTPINQPFIANCFDTLFLQYDSPILEF